ncbi:MAG: sodium:solute symporter [Bacteroidales bacterium]|nr:sodium:solute symporter [Bacteroidales bacterium]
MSSTLIVIIIASYFVLLLIISLISGRNADNEAFFLGNRRSPWYIVAFGMIGATISGVTFISVPGWVVDSQFTYMQMVLGYLAGYAVIAQILMPLYYRLKLTSIYSYLEQRFGFYSYKTGASLFLISRIIGASFRLYLVAMVLQMTLFDTWRVPFFITVVVTIVLIWLYTNRGGIKTIIWTDTLQTFFMLAAVITTIVIITRSFDAGIPEMIAKVSRDEHSRIWVFGDWRAGNHFIKHFLSGAFITIVMTGLDQDMMQKNLSCRNIRDAKKNMYLMSLSLVPVNLIFLFLGALLVLFANQNQIPIPADTDDLFPLIVTGGHLPQVIGVFFLLGLIAAAYSSADSALTALTTSFTVDILNSRKWSEKKLMRNRKIVHVGISFLLGTVIMIFQAIHNENVITAVFTMAGYTYGPLLGLYAFGLFTGRGVKDRWVPLIAILAPLLSYLVSYFSEEILDGYRFGFELLIVNGLITFAGLMLISVRRNAPVRKAAPPGSGYPG